MKEGLKLISRFIPDKLYLQIKYRYMMGERLNLAKPQNFNQKLQWLKLYNRKNIQTDLVDKYNVREYISKKIGEEYLIPLLGVYENIEEIEWNNLPNSFVLKCTHGSSCNIICKDRNKLDIEDTKRKLNKWLKNNWFWYGREWPYRNVKPRIICEKYMTEANQMEIKDYKFFCFNGEPKIIQVDYDRFSNHKRNLYNTKWELMDFSIKVPNDKNNKIDRPEKLEKMLELARILSEGHIHARIDFYYIENRIYFGEITFYHGAGFEKFTPNSYNKLMGDWINLG